MLQEPSLRKATRELRPEQIRLPRRKRPVAALVMGGRLYLPKAGRHVRRNDGPLSISKSIMSSSRAGARSGVLVFMTLATTGSLVLGLPALSPEGGTASVVIGAAGGMLLRRFEPGIHAGRIVKFTAMASGLIALPAITIDRGYPFGVAVTAMTMAWVFTVSSDAARCLRAWGVRMRRE